MVWFPNQTTAYCWLWLVFNGFRTFEHKSFQDLHLPHQSKIMNKITHAQMHVVITMQDKYICMNMSSLTARKKMRYLSIIYIRSPRFLEISKKQKSVCTNPCKIRIAPSNRPDCRAFHTYSIWIPRQSEGKSGKFPSS